MSRPANPAWVIPTWAPNANYGASADPWSATPTKQAHPGAASVGFTPRAAVPAQCVNKLLNDAYGTDQTAKSYIGSVLDWTGQAPALTFHTDVTTGFTALAFVKYSAALRKWLYCGGVDGFSRSQDIAGAAGSTEVVGGAVAVSNESYDFDVDATGNIVIAPDAIDAVQECSAAGTWTRHLAVTGGTSLATPSIVWDAFSGRWIIASVLAGGMVLISSTDRVTWAALPHPGLTNGSVIMLGSGAESSLGPGRLVAQGFSGTNVQFAFSSDGGTTWSAVTTIALGFTQYNAAYRYPKPVWNGSYWLACAFSSGTASKVFKSLDGITWTTVATFANAAFRCIAAMGELWLAVTQAGEYAVSADAGVTWRFGDRRFPSAQVISVAATGMRFVVVGQQKVYPGPAMGLGQNAVT